MVGDFNGHHPIWSLPGAQNNTTGNAIAQILTNYQDISLNTPSGLVTFIHSATGSPSVIDLCFSSSNIAADITVEREECLGSDHFPIKITLNKSPASQTITTRKRYKIKTVNWAQWRAGLPNLVWGEDESAESINRMLIESIKSSSVQIEKTSGKYNPKYNTPWWDDECERLVSLRKTAKGRLRRCQNAQNIQKLREAENNAKNYIKNLKQKSWQEYASTLTANSPTSSIWKSIKILRNSYTPPLTFPYTVIIDGNNILTTPHDIAESSANHFQIIFQTIYNNPHLNEMYFSIQTAIIDETPKEYNLPYTPLEIKQSIKALKNTSPGSDDIENVFIRELPTSYLDFLLRLINKSWIEETMPESWKFALLVPILKAGKDSMSKASYRPISMLSCIGKLMGRMVNDRLDWHIERNLLLSQAQAGFRKQHSTYDQLTLLENKIKKSLSLNQHCLAVFLDLAGAFDAVNHTVVLFKLRKIGISGRMLGWLQSYLLDRKFAVQYNGAMSSTRPIKTGVPQGGLLSPLLFNVLMSDLPVEDGIQMSLYADDIAIFASGCRPAEVAERIQGQLDSITRWTVEWGQTLNPEKSKAMYFTNETNHAPPNLHIHNCNLEFVQQQRYCLLYTSPSPRDKRQSRMPSSA